MVKVNIHQAKTHLSRYVARAEKGETVVLCRRNKPVAEIRGIPKTLRDRRPVGLDRGKFVVTPAFFDPLPQDIVGHLAGKLF